MDSLDEQPLRIYEHGKTIGSGKRPAMVQYVDHQPGDATRYEVLGVDLLGKGVHIGNLGYVAEDAMVIVCGMEYRSSAALFKRGQHFSEFDIAERFGLKNEHTIHHIGEIVAHMIGGKVACRHNADESPLR